MEKYTFKNQAICWSHDGVTSEESDPTLVTSVSSHLDVAFLSIGYTPATIEEHLDYKTEIKFYTFPFNAKISDSPILDQPVVVSILGAVAHSQHAMGHIVGAAVVPVHSCRVTQQVKTSGKHSHRSQHVLSKLTTKIKLVI